MKNNIWTYIRLILYLCIIIAVVFCTTNNIYIACHFVESFGITCPACGATRATISILKGDILAAIEYNAFYSLVVFPFFIIFMLEDVYVVLKRSVLKTLEISLIETLFGGIA